MPYALSAILLAGCMIGCTGGMDSETENAITIALVQHLIYQQYHAPSADTAPTQYDVVCVGVRTDRGDTASDPPVSVVEYFQGHEPAVLPVSECERRDLDADVYTIDLRPVEYRDDESALIKVARNEELFSNGKDASYWDGWDCDLKKAQPAGWEVLRCKAHWFDDPPPPDL